MSWKWELEGNLKMERTDRLFILVGYRQIDPFFLIFLVTSKSCSFQRSANFRGSRLFH
jgi:hypothetical protein